MLFKIPECFPRQPVFSFKSFASLKPAICFSFLSARAWCEITINRFLWQKFVPGMIFKTESSAPYSWFKPFLLYFKRARKYEKNHEFSIVICMRSMNSALPRAVKWGEANEKKKHVSPPSHHFLPRLSSGHGIGFGHWIIILARTIRWCNCMI